MQELEIYNCPRLNDWSALTGRSIHEISLDGLFTLPDFGNVVSKNISLTTIFDLKDLSCFENRIGTTSPSWTWTGSRTCRPSTT